MSSAISRSRKPTQPFLPRPHGDQRRPPGDRAAPCPRPQAAEYLNNAPVPPILERSKQRADYVAVASGMRARRTRSFSRRASARTRHRRGSVLPWPRRSAPEHNRIRRPIRGVTRYCFPLASRVKYLVVLFFQVGSCRRSSSPTRRVFRANGSAIGCSAMPPAAGSAKGGSCRSSRNEHGK